MQQMTFYFGYKNVELLFAGLLINTPGGESELLTDEPTGSTIPRSPLRGLLREPFYHKVVPKAELTFTLLLRV